MARLTDHFSLPSLFRAGGWAEAPATPGGGRRPRPQAQLPAPWLRRLLSHRLVLLALWVFVAGLGGCDPWLISAWSKSGVSCSWPALISVSLLLEGPLKSSWLLPASEEQRGLRFPHLSISLAGCAAWMGAGWVPVLVWGLVTCRTASFRVRRGVCSRGTSAQPSEATNLAFPAWANLRRTGEGEMKTTLAISLLSPPPLLLATTTHISKGQISSFLTSFTWQKGYFFFLLIVVDLYDLKPPCLVVKLLRPQKGVEWIPFFKRLA